MIHLTDANKLACANLHPGLTVLVVVDSILLTSANKLAYIILIVEDNLLIVLHVVDGHP